MLLYFNYTIIESPQIVNSQVEPPHSYVYVWTDHDTIIFTLIYFTAKRSADSTVVRDSIGAPLP